MLNTNIIINKYKKTVAFYKRIYILLGGNKKASAAHSNTDLV